MLVACEESQRVCMAFREKGHEAYSCDIIECSGGHPEWHIQGDVLRVLNPIAYFEDELPHIEFWTSDQMYHTVEKWDLIIAHPPCTYITAASACRMYPKKGEAPDIDRLLKMLEAVQFFTKYYLQIVKRYV